MIPTLVAAFFAVIVRVTSRPRESAWPPPVVARARALGRGGRHTVALAHCSHCLRPTLDTLQEHGIDVLEWFPEMCLCPPTK